ncbi:helix-turn-helix transcriptional regulator [Zoogloea sp.]|uniref:helix-turn-helix domain-containing protein n=1 Tax=Zoogloea sp. TaxID=49181 RepID=UPI001416ABFB|nr:MAG: helix-turn-helix transcriptional regulator [Zoogloea sp.]
MNILNVIGNNVREFRKKLGLSQEELADLSGVHRTYIGAVERGEKNISALSIAKIAKALKVKPDKLLIE